MDKLEKIGGQDITAIYTQLGRELQEELERLKLSGESERLADVRKSFEEFLGKVNENRDKSDYNSLLWIGETYFSLGQGAEDDPAAAADYFNKARQAYQDILDNKLVEGGSVLAIKLRLVKCLRAEGNYEQAIELAKSILATNPMSLDVQFEAAGTLSDWGDAPGGGDPKYLLVAIQGEDKIWGWSGLTTRLQARQTTPEWENLKDQFLTARYEYINSRYRYAKTGAADADKQLSSGMGELTMFGLAFRDLSDEWYAKFDGLYQKFRADKGLPPEPLKRPEKIELPPEAMVAQEQTEQPAAEEAKAEEAADIAPPDPPNPIFLGIAVGLAAVGGFFFYRSFSKANPSGVHFQVRMGQSFRLPPSGTLLPGGSDDAPDFSAFAGVGAPTNGPVAPPVKKKKKKKVAPAKAPGAEAAAAGAATVAKKAPGKKVAARKKVAGAAQEPATGAPAKKKKKRVLTPEEMARYKAAKAAKAKAAAAAAAGEAPPQGVKKKAPAKKKIVKKRPPEAQ